ncbi:MAG: glycoside hydrolase family 2 TIM barrel-domain containing protein [Rikenellaceae bacterium]
MKVNRLILLALIAVIVSSELFAWQKKGDRISTRWGKEVTPENAWQQYPRPQLQREDWVNLNGLWDYAITDMNCEKSNVKFEGEILVPYAVESSLSGVQRQFLPTDKLWYKRTFEVDKSWIGKNIILHFGAVDYASTIWVNGKEVGKHIGGNNSFSFDITKYLKKSGSQTVELSVTDPTETKTVTQGKQRIDAKGIFYTAVSGIWKTVWLEAVNSRHIEEVAYTSDIDKMSVSLDIDFNNLKGDEQVKIDIYDSGKAIKSYTQNASEKLDIDMQGATLWSPESPKLYHFEIELTSKGKLLDRSKSYFAMRKVSVEKDECGYNRTFLNNKPIFQYGTLDQGWWPESLLTPPSAEAMMWDIVQLKELGFNTIRKHIKVEPELYYYYADSLGMMVWQDMVSGFVKGKNQVRPFAADDWDAPMSHSEQWEKELYEMIDCLKFFPSITTWVIFNEGWGQYDTKNITNSVMSYDNTRIINGVSGWEDRKVGHMYDIHNYPYATMILPEYNDNRISALGEFGGLGLPIENHLWNPDMRNWGYKDIDGNSALIENYANVIYDLETLIAQGLAAAIYTQTSDVEGEVNGLITYDREIVKLPKTLAHALHDRLYRIKSAKATTLIEDFQGGIKHKRMTSIKGGDLKLLELPLTIDESSDIVSITEFNADKEFSHLSLWTNLTGDVKISLNGVEIMNETVTQQRHYNQFNLSDYAKYLKIGKNCLKIESKGASKIEFDYGLRAF